MLASQKGLEPRLSTGFLLLWVAQSEELCPVFPRPGTGQEDRSLSFCSCLSRR